jgi:hypothetical protein
MLITLLQKISYSFSLAIAPLISFSAWKINWMDSGFFQLFRGVAPHLSQNDMMKMEIKGSVFVYRVQPYFQMLPVTNSDSFVITICKLNSLGIAIFYHASERRQTQRIRKEQGHPSLLVGVHYTMIK